MDNDTIQMLQRPPSSPDLTPRDYWMFSDMKGVTGEDGSLARSQCWDLPSTSMVKEALFRALGQPSTT